MFYKQGKPRFAMLGPERAPHFDSKFDECEVCLVV